MVLNPTVSNAAEKVENEAIRIPAQTEMSELLSEYSDLLACICGRKFTRQQLYRCVSAYFTGWVETGALSNEAIVLLLWNKAQVADSR